MSSATPGTATRQAISTAAAVAFVVVVAAFVLLAARSGSSEADPSAAWGGVGAGNVTGQALAGPDVLAAIQTRTSTPETEDNPTGPTLTDFDVQALLAGDDVPATGGFTDLIRRYFGDHTVEAIVIVQCESTFDPDAVGTNTNGTQDHGLFQINDVHREAFEVVTGRSWDERYDPELNTSFAAWLFDHADGWGPWRCNRHLVAFDGEPDDL